MGRVLKIVGTETITGGLVSADGSTYEVNVTYGSEAGIPKGSTLKLVEYAEGSLEYQQAKNKVDEYREEEANAQEEEMDAAESAFSDTIDEVELPQPERTLSSRITASRSENRFLFIVQSPSRS